MTEACASSPLALPDAAFAAVRVAADAGGHIVAPAGYEGAKLWSVVPVAWRPDGAALAAILPDDGFAAQSQTLRVTLYSTQSGSLIAHLTARRANDGDAAQGMIAPVLMWAPNGKHLSLVDYDSGFITIWSGHALPGGS
ncbi:MAG TPA: hypothetical protein VFQ25_03265 [Ktedonobacterales bacterium]|nr:hypothetical protein [Ktedonobacterales bacterium]